MSQFAIGLILGLSVAAVGGWLLYRRLLVVQARFRDSQRLAELGTLTAGLAHEIKNPLSTVQLNLQLLSEDLHSDRTAAPRSLNRLATVQREASRLREILDDFLRYAGRLEPELQSVNMTELINDLVDFFYPQAQAAKVQIRFHPTPQPVMAQVDPRLIKQALLNLMLNATQAMTGGGELILNLSQSDDQIMIDITDTGPGIAPEEQQKIFDAYFSKRRGGVGLGLAMTRRIVQLHNGQITLSSELGKGTRFTLNLPVEKQ